MASGHRKTVKARELPTEWRDEGRFAPDDEVTVTVAAANSRGADSPKRFIGAGKGVFSSAREVDAYLRRQRGV